ncbi:MAG: ribosome-binding factor A [Myxococcota bacterium]|jgi:ribosome-binding factor A
MSGNNFKRSDRVAQSIRAVLAQTLAERVSDPRLQGVMVTEVSLHDDLRGGKVFWYFMRPGQTERVREAQRAFRSASKMLRSQVGKSLSLKHVPDLKFVYDERIDHARHIESLLEGVLPPAGDSTEGSTESDGE